MRAGDFGHAIPLIALLWESLVMLPPLLEPQVSHLGDDGDVELLCRHQGEPPASDTEEQCVGVRGQLKKPEKGKADRCRWDIANSLLLSLWMCSTHLCLECWAIHPLDTTLQVFFVVSLP